MPEQRANDRNRERMDDDRRGFETARRDLAESRAENRAAAEAFGEREQEEREDEEREGADRGQGERGER